MYSSTDQPAHRRLAPVLLTAGLLASAVVATALPDSHAVSPVRTLYCPVGYPHPLTAARPPRTTGQGLGASPTPTAPPTRRPCRRPVH